MLHSACVCDPPSCSPLAHIPLLTTTPNTLVLSFIVRRLYGYCKILPPNLLVPYNCVSKKRVKPGRLLFIPPLTLPPSLPSPPTPLYQDASNNPKGVVRNDTTFAAKSFRAIPVARSFVNHATGSRSMVSLASPGDAFGPRSLYTCGWCAPNHILRHRALSVKKRVKSAGLQPG